MLWWTVRQLKSKDPETRARAVQKLKSVPSADARQGIAAMLGRLGPEGLDLLVGMLESDPDHEVRMAAARALYDCRDERAIEALVRALTRDEKPEVRDQAGRVLGILGAAAVPLLLTALESPRVSDRERVAQWFGRVGVPEAIPALSARLDDDSSVARAAAASLQSLGWTPTAVRDRVQLALALDDEKALANVAPEAVDLLGDVLSRSDRSFRHKAAWALGVSGDPRALPALVKTLGDDDPAVRRSAVVALSRLGWAPSTAQEQAHVQRVVEDLVPFAERGLPGPTCGDAALALGQIGGASAMAALKSVLDRENTPHEVRRTVADALVNSRDPAASGILVAAMEKGRLDWSATADKMAKVEGPMRDAIVSVLETLDRKTPSDAIWALAGTDWTPQPQHERLEVFLQAGAEPAPGFRRVLLELIGRRRGEWARGILIGCLTDPVYAVRKTAASRLRAFGVDAVAEKALDVKPTPGECAICGSRLSDAPLVDDSTIGRILVSQGPQAADVLLRAACACQCGLPVCRACNNHSRSRCPDCDRKFGGA